MKDDRKAEYTASLAKKSIKEMKEELEQVQNKLDILFTMQNSLETTDLTEGGGEPHIQAEYQDCTMRQQVLTVEIQKREMLEMLG
jgi:hypothetical protein